MTKAWPNLFMGHTPALSGSIFQSIHSILTKRSGGYFQRLLSMGLFVYLICVIGNQTAIAQWSPNAPVTISGSGQHPGIIGDKTGGVIVAWFTGSAIVAQRINAAGNIQWAAGGITIGSGFGQQIPVSITGDGSGGAIITWISGGFDIYAQRINALGVLQWTAGGVPICTASNNQLDPSIVSDGTGGAIITWYDYRSGTRIYAQRVNASGNVQWTSNGIAICTSTSTGSNNSDGPQIVSDEAGGAIISWKDNRDGNVDIYAQRIDAAGVMQWTPNGNVICNVTSTEDGPKLVSDESGGAIIAWMDNRNGNNDIYAQRINATGTTLWPEGGIAVCTLGGSDHSLAVASDEVGGAIIAWGRTNDIYAQRINSSGVVQWTNPLAISAAVNEQSLPSIAGDGMGGAIITWFDFRSGTNYDIYAQRVNGSGVIQWTTDGIGVCTTAANQGYPVILNNELNGAFVTWQYSPPGGIFAQNVNDDGMIGPPAIPVISCPAGNASLTSNLTGTTYQWQLNSGSGFANIADNSNYTGTNAVTLGLNNIPSGWYGYIYRCVVNGATSANYKLKFRDNWTGTTNIHWENPSNWNCGTVPDANTDVIINSGTVVINVNTTVRSLTIATGVVLTVMPGVILTVTH